MEKDKFSEGNRKSRAYFEGLLEEHGDDVKSLGYGSRKAQEKKFEALMEAGDLNGKTLLDVGCGFGDLHAFLERCGVRLKGYRGVDISPAIVETGRKKYPGLDVRVQDILTLKEEWKFDYVVATGFNCHRTGDNRGLEQAILRRMFDLCTTGCAASFESSYSPFGDSDGLDHLSDPLELFDFVMRTVTPHVRLIHDYLPHDFTLCYYREDREGRVGTQAGRGAGRAAED